MNAIDALMQLLPLYTVPKLPTTTSYFEFSSELLPVRVLVRLRLISLQELSIVLTGTSQQDGGRVLLLLSEPVEVV